MVVPKGPDLAAAEATVGRLRQALRELEALVSEHQVATASAKACLIANTLQLELASNEASAQASVMEVLQSTKLKIQSEVDGKLTNLVARFTRARLPCTHTALALRWTGLSHRIHGVRHRR